MVFSSPVFLFFFLPLTLLAVFAVRQELRNLVLLIASLFFYAWGESTIVLVLCFSILVNYLLGLWLDRTFSRLGAKLIVALALLFNLGLLVYFKYSSFFVALANPVLTRFHFPAVSWPAVYLPIGVSFFTFQAMSYVIDVYRKDTAATANFVRFALFKSLFPQLIAGPIVRYRDIAEQLKSRRLSPEKFAEGIQRFILGLAKKALIANTLANVVDPIFSTPLGNLTTPLAWLGALGFLAQIYFDFSGYSDMAIGLGKMFGFDFLENFNYPYISQSLQEFWRRWHISLSTWFRDYLYIPLGGNRHGVAREYFNLFIVFLLCGLWHGASWNFIIFGALQGVFLVAERLGGNRLLKRLWRPARHAYLLLVMTVSFAVFRAPDLRTAGALLKRMFFLGQPPVDFDLAQFYLTPELCFTLAAAAIGSTPLVARWLTAWQPATAPAEWIPGLTWKKYAVVGFLFVLFILSAMSLASGTYSSFIYFRF
jgi:alginate O-acetyltransferase complex protein AlgI